MNWKKTLTFTWVLYKTIQNNMIKIVLVIIIHHTQTNLLGKFYSIFRN